MNTFLTETTYISIYPSSQTLSSNDAIATLDRDLQKHEPFYIKQFPNATQRKQVFVQFLKREMKDSHFHTVDQKIHSRMFQKQKGIDNTNAMITELGHDPYIDELLKQKDCRKCYREKSKEKKRVAKQS